jgi:ribosomal protein L2
VGLFLFKSFLGNISVVILPSLKVKLLSDLDRSFVGRLYYADKQDFLYTKAGYNINKGRGPTVRGTVKNACDHPNGGRTRSLKLSMTP